ncbi:MAG: FHA domain-containing protein [Woeseiaceae bacterium]
MQSDTQQTLQETGRTSIGIRGGIHESAESPLGDQQIILIGSAGDCDIQLADAGVAAHHIAIGTRDTQFVVRPMDGGCSVNGKTVRAGRSAAIKRGDRIALDDTEVWLTTTETHSDADARVGDDTLQPERQASRRWRWTYPVGVAIIAITTTFGGQQLLSKDALVPDDAVNVSGVLQDLGIDADVTLSNDAGTVMLQGVLPDEMFAELDRALGFANREVVNRTQSVSQLLEQVRSVFRTNGYHAALEYVGNAQVQVTNLDPENPKIQRVAAYARDDVSILAALTFAPFSDANRSNKRLAVFSTNPEKRLTTIVDGDTAYVATTDGGRYFVGSVLPGGLVLRDISVDGIQVDDNGQIHWLTL